MNIKGDELKLSFSNKTLKKQQGFTLIELVVVIVILGVLAVTAAPKFINIQADARTSTLQGVKAAMESAAAMVYSKSLIKGNQALPSSATPAPTVTLANGDVINLHYGYPNIIASDWDKLLDLNSNDFKVTPAISAHVLVYPVAEFATAPFDVSLACLVHYSTATATSKPLIEVNKC